MFSVDAVGRRVGIEAPPGGVTPQPPVTGHALVGRAVELHQIRSALDSAAVGLGRLVVVYGTAGIGRSSLLAAAAGLATDAGMQVLTARGSELERGYPFGVARQLFEDHVPDLPAAGDSTGYDRIHALQVMAQRLAARRPLLLTVDDVQWCDRPSLDFLCYLGHRASRLPIVVLLAWRRGEPGVRAGRLQALAGRPDTTFLSPRPLDVDAVRTVLAGELVPTHPAPTHPAPTHPPPAPGVAQAVRERTSGLPFLVCELGAALRAHAGTSPTPELVRTITPELVRTITPELVRTITPELVRRDVAARLARHPEAVQRFAQAVAVLGEPCPIARAGELAELEPDRAPAAADALERAGILRHDDAVAFSAPLFRDAVYGTLSSVERAQLHERAARLMTGGPGEADVERVAEHILLGLPAQDRGWQPTLLEAARRAGARGAGPFARRCLQRALAEAALDGRAEVLAELGRSELALGELADAERHLREARSLARTPPERRRLQIELQAAGALLEVCHGPAPVPAVDLDPAHAATAGERALLAASCLAAARHLLGDARRILDCCRAVLAGATLQSEPAAAYVACVAALLAGGRDLLEATPLSAPGAPALALRAQLSLCRGDLGLADEEAAAALDLVPAAAPAPLWHRVRGDCLVVRTLVALHRNQPERARQLLDSLAPEDVATVPLAALLALGAAPDDPVRPAQAHLSAARAWGAPSLLAEALLTSAAVGAADERRPAIEEALAVLAGVDAPLTLARARIELGGVLRRQGRRRDAREQLQLGADLAHRCGAVGLAERARSELVAAGARPRRRAFSGLDSLTVSERRVAELAAAEMTNRQIAEALTVSMKTVAGQLNAVYRKLDVHDRRALADVLAADPIGAHA